MTLEWFKVTTAYRPTRSPSSACKALATEGIAMQDATLYALLVRADQGDDAARDELYDDYGINDEDRDAMLAHAARHSVPTLGAAS